MVLNAVGALMWAVVVAGAGSRLGRVGEVAFSWVGAHASSLILVLLGVGVVCGLYGLYRQPKRTNPFSESSS